MANRVLTEKSRPVLIAARIEDNPCVFFRYRSWCLRVLRLRNPHLPSTATRSKIPWYLLSWLIIVKTGRGQSFRPIETNRAITSSGVARHCRPPPPNPPVFVTKATYVDGAIALAEFSTTYVGKYSHRTAKYTPDGLPKNFDHRSDVTYKMHAVITSGDDTTEERTSTISYKFKSEETTAVGPCVLQMIHGESDTTNDAARTRHRYQLYFPELRISATEVDAEPIVDSLSTVFSEIKPVN
jgi:hypothetical protein